MDHSFAENVYYKYATIYYFMISAQADEKRKSVPWCNRSEIQFHKSFSISKISSQKLIVFFLQKREVCGWGTLKSPLLAFCLCLA
jgi:hypothetical protein